MEGCYVLWDCILFQAMSGTSVEHDTQPGEEPSRVRASHAAGDTCPISKSKNAYISACLTRNSRRTHRASRDPNWSPSAALINEPPPRMLAGSEERTSGTTPSFVEPSAWIWFRPSSPPKEVSAGLHHNVSTDNLLPFSGTYEIDPPSKSTNFTFSPDRIDAPQSADPAQMIFPSSTITVPDD